MIGLSANHLSSYIAAEAPPPPLGLFETLEGLAALDYAAAVKDNPDTTKDEAKPAALGVTDFKYGFDPLTQSLLAYNVANTGPTTITPAVKENPDTVATEAKAAIASTAVTETDAALNSAGLTFSRYSGTATCDLNADETECAANRVTDITALAAETQVTADGVKVMAGDKTVTLASTGLNNGGNVLSGVADGVAATDAVNRRQLDAVRNDLTAVRNDLATESASRIAGDKRLRDEIASSTATAIALGGATILPDVNFSLSGNVGFYQGATALAVNAAARIAPNTYVTGAIGGGLNKHGQVGGRVGFAFGF